MLLLLFLKHYVYNAAVISPLDFFWLCMFLKIKKSLGTPQSQNKTFKNYKIVIKIELQKNFKGSEIGVQNGPKNLRKDAKGSKTS